MTNTLLALAALATALASPAATCTPAATSTPTPARSPRSTSTPTPTPEPTSTPCALVLLHSAAGAAVYFPEGPGQVFVIQRLQSGLTEIEIPDAAGALHSFQVKEDVNQVLAALRTWCF
jgi:hypothetical protein